MSGLNYGNSFQLGSVDFKNRDIGVSYAPKAKKWIVRIYKAGTKQITTIGCYKTKNEADDVYNNWINNPL